MPDTVVIDGVEFVRADLCGPAEVSDDNPPYGGVMLIETVTKYFVGEVVSVHPQEIVLRDACWVADTGRWHKFLKGTNDDRTEFEPCPDGIAIIGRGSIVDAVPYRYSLIRVVK